jgi:hypothetical protein
VSNQQLHHLYQVLVIGVLLASTPATSRGAVIYDFVSLSVLGSETFTYVAPDFVTADVFIPASELSSCTINNPFGPHIDCFAIGILPSGPDTGKHYAEIKFVGVVIPGQETDSTFYYFPEGAFSKAGTYFNVIPETQARLAVIPEPMTFGFVGAGTLFFIMRGRRRKLGSTPPGR